MISFHPSITLAEAAKVAAELGCYLKSDGRGNIVITPRDGQAAAARRPAHTNANVVKMAHHHHQYSETLPGPEAA